MEKETPLTDEEIDELEEFGAYYLGVGVGDDFRAWQEVAHLIAEVRRWRAKEKHGPSDLSPA